MRALLLLMSLALLVVAAIPLAGDLAGVRLMGSPSAASAEGPRVLLDNNFVVSLFWAVGWLTLALLCGAAALALDQQKRLLRLYRQLDRHLGEAPQPARQAREAPRPAPKGRFEPRIAPAPASQPPASQTEWRARREDPPARGPVLRAER